MKIDLRSYLLRELIQKLHIKARPFVYIFIYLQLRHIKTFNTLQLK